MIVRRLMVVAGLLALASSVAHAQQKRIADPPPVNVQVYTVPEPTVPAGPTAGPALPPVEADRLLRAVALRTSGLPERSRDTLLVMLRAFPHHPRIVTELGRAHVARNDWSAVERLAVTERLAARDTSLLAQELALAQERLGRPRDALRTAVDAWTVDPADGPWAAPVVFRVSAAEPKLAVLALETAMIARPWRTDLAIGLARLHAVNGRPIEATRALADAERRSGRPGLRILFADESMRAANSRDSTTAFTVLLDLARETSRRPEERAASGRRLWVAAQASGREAEWGPRLAQAMRDVPGERWGADFILTLVRSLQRTGAVGEARALLAANPGLERRLPELKLERAATLAREDQLPRARQVLDSLVATLPQARFLRAELEFFAGDLDSARAHYEEVTTRPDDPDAATALERLYLLEEAPRSEVRPLLGRIAFERWRNHRTAALTLADSLWRRQQPRGDYAAHAGIELAALRVAAGDVRGALVPLLVVCDSLPDDRLAPLARQRAGDAYAALGDDTAALFHYEECLARYPRAWNSPEVRRRVERLRKEKRL